MVGQEHTPFDFREVMDQGRIVLIKLGKGRFGASVSGLLAAQIVSRFQNRSHESSQYSGAQRRPFFLYVDEFQKYSPGGFHRTPRRSPQNTSWDWCLQINSRRNSISHTRGSRVLLQAVLGMSAFSSYSAWGLPTLKLLNLIFHPPFSEKDLKELPNWQAYVQLHIEGKVLTPFNIETVLDKTPPGPEDWREDSQNVPTKIWQTCARHRSANLRPEKILFGVIHRRINELGSEVPGFLSRPSCGVTWTVRRLHFAGRETLSGVNTELRFALKYASNVERCGIGRYWPSKKGKRDEKQDEGARGEKDAETARPKAAIPASKVMSSAKDYDRKREKTDHRCMEDDG